MFWVNPLPVINPLPVPGSSALNDTFAQAVDWSTGFVPTANDNVALINLGQPYTVQLISTDLIPTNLTVNTIAIVEGVKLNIPGGSTFTVLSGTGLGGNAGTVSVAPFHLNNPNDPNDPIVTGGTFVLSGFWQNTDSGTLQAISGGTIKLKDATVIGGQIELQANGKLTNLEIAGSVSLQNVAVTLSDDANNRIVGNGLAPTLTNEGSISGAGTIGDSNLTLLNYGEIAASGLANELVLNTGANVITNKPGGILEARNGATLEIDSTLSNAGATIRADNGGTLELVNDAVTGGMIVLNGASLPTMLQIEGTVTLTGGTVTLSNYSGNSIVGTNDEIPGPPGPKLINQDVISGGGDDRRRQPDAGQLCND